MPLLGHGGLDLRSDYSNQGSHKGCPYRFNERDYLSQRSDGA